MKEQLRKQARHEAIEVEPDVLDSWRVRSAGAEASYDALGAIAVGRVV